MAGMKKTPINFRLDPDLLENLRTMAKADNRALNNLVETILMQHIALCNIAKKPK